MKPERRIDPDVDLTGEEQMDRLERLIAHALAARVNVVNHEAEKGVRGWIVGLGSTLLVAFILAGWGLSNQVAALQAEVTDLKIEVAELKKLVEPRYRSP